MSDHQIEIFWDVGSPYTHLAIAQLEAIGKSSGLPIKLRPFLIGGVFKAVGNSMPGILPPKAKYMMHDLTRWREYLKVDLKLPSEGTPFPINSLKPMRVAMLCETRGNGQAYCEALFSAYWGRGEDVSDPSVLNGVIDSVGLDPAETLEAAGSDENKAALRANTDEAVERGAFGAPSLFVGDQLFWGNDRIGLMLDYIAKL